jgi:D-sedoheptulose 7-phosphate isomerase
MTQRDPRHRNDYGDSGDLPDFARAYAARLESALSGIDMTQLQHALALIEGTAVQGRHIYSIGNGGSAAIAEHLCCDWTKGTHHPDHPVIDSRSLATNMALYSAIANDFGFEKVFETQVQMLGKPGDVLIAVSSSGNSPNIIAAVEAARAKGMKTIGMTGFSGGRLREAADVSIHVGINNYGIVEDTHQAVTHILAQFIARKRDGAAQ